MGDNDDADGRSSGEDVAGRLAMKYRARKPKYKPRPKQQPADDVTDEDRVPTDEEEDDRPARPSRSAKPRSILRPPADPPSRRGGDRDSDRPSRRDPDADPPPRRDRDLDPPPSRDRDRDRDPPSRRDRDLDPPPSRDRDRDRDPPSRRDPPASRYDPDLDPPRRGGRDYDPPRRNRDDDDQVFDSKRRELDRRMKNIDKVLNYIKNQPVQYQPADSAQPSDPLPARNQQAQRRDRDRGEPDRRRSASTRVRFEPARKPVDDTPQRSKSTRRSQQRDSSELESDDPDVIVERYLIDRQRNKRR